MIKIFGRYISCIPSKTQAKQIRRFLTYLMQEAMKLPLPEWIVPTPTDKSAVNTPTAN